MKLKHHDRVSKLVDKYGIEHVVTTLAGICASRADTIREETATKALTDKEMVAWEDVSDALHNLAEAYYMAHVPNPQRDRKTFTIDPKASGRAAIPLGTLERSG